MKTPTFIALVLALATTASALDNGAANTPPLGWCSWQRYRCTIKCDVPMSTSPNCFNEGLIRATADAIAGNPKLKAAGYEYVALDDCWQGPSRVDGHVVADPDRFPSGIKALAAYVHSKGLKFGLYTAIGNMTCATPRYAKDPLGLGCDYDRIPECTVAKRDMDDFVSWDIDHIKVDGCGGFDSQHQNASYAIVGSFLQDAVKRRGTGPVVYHPSNLGFEFPRQLRELASIANQWRFYNDVQDSWGSVAGIIQQIGAGQPDCLPGPLPPNCTGRIRGDISTFCASYCVERDQFLRVPARGGYHDPDMLLVGETPCTPAATKAGMKCSVLPFVEQQTQMAVWSMASAPLLLSADLTQIPADSLDILTNPEALAIDQDAMARMAFRFYSGPDGVDMWRKDLSGGDVAVAIVYMGAAPSPSPNPPGAWVGTPGEIYDDAECPNLGNSPMCSGLDSARTIECAQQSCLADMACTAINVAISGEHLGHYVKRGCSAGNASRPEWKNGPGWMGFHFAALPRPVPPEARPLPSGFVLDLADAGFAATTPVSVRDIFNQTSLGVHRGTFATPRPIPPHGVLWLRLSFAPLYGAPAKRTEL